MLVTEKGGEDCRQHAIHHKDQISKISKAAGNTMTGKKRVLQVSAARLGMSIAVDRKYPYISL